MPAIFLPGATILEQRSCQLKKPWGLSRRGPETFGPRSRGLRLQESPGTDMVSVSRVREVGGPPVSPRSEADTVPLPQGVVQLSILGSLSRWDSIVYHPVFYRQLRPRCARSPQVVGPARESCGIFRRYVDCGLLWCCTPVSVVCSSRFSDSRVGSSEVSTLLPLQPSDL